MNTPATSPTQYLAAEWLLSNAKQLYAALGRPDSFARKTGRRRRPPSPDSIQSGAAFRRRLPAIGGSTRVDAGPHGEISFPRRARDPRLLRHSARLRRQSIRPDSASETRIRASEAEGVGFEPTERLTTFNGFRDRHGQRKVPAKRDFGRA